MQANGVSIIIPLYNRAPFIDRCLQSVTAQSYANLEILLLVGASQDQSLVKCLEWQQKDPRITVVSRKERQVGNARNLGVRIATGDFIAFVDVDDWVSPQFIEKLLHPLLESDADLSCCDLVGVRREGKEKAYQCLDDFCGLIHTDFAFFANFILSSVCNKLFRKRFFQTNELLFPEGRQEDDALHLLLCCLAPKVFCVHEMLYFYFLDTPVSIMHTNGEEDKVIASLEFARRWLVRRNLYEARQVEVDRYLKRYFHRWLSRTNSDAIKAHLRRRFPSYEREVRYRYAAFGSLNLRWVVHHLSYDASQLVLDYCFSSLIAQIAQQSIQLEIRHSNPFRRKMVLQDVSHSLFACLDEKPCDYFFLDFMEERFDLLQAPNGAILTKSDAFDSVEDAAAAFADFPRIPKASQQYIELWERSCDAFIAQLKQRFRPSQIVLLRMRLADSHGRGAKEHAYENAEEIHAFNRLFAWMETYFMQRYVGIHVIELLEDSLYTDSKHPHGREPIHLNRRLYSALAEEINRRLYKTEEKT